MILSSMMMIAASTPVNIDGGVRVRFREVLHHEELVHNPQLQSRIGLLWGKDKPFGGRIVMQDVRRLSEMTRSQAGTLMLHQGYVRSTLRKSVTIDAGRRELNLGSGRLVSSARWSDNGRAFDGLFLTINNRVFPFGLTAWATQPGTPGSQGKRFSGAYLQKNLNAFIQLEAWWMRTQKLSSQMDRHTLGGAARVKGRALKADLEGSYQLGDNAEHAIAAWGGSLQTQWRVPRNRFKPELGAELNLASGDSDKADQIDQTFDSLYAARHQYWGHLDLMGGRNAMDLHFWVGTTLAKTAFSVHGHLLSLQSQADDFYLSNGSGRALDLTQVTGSDVGTEIDVTAKKIYGQFTIEAGLSVFLPGAVAKSSDLGEKPIIGGYIQLESRFK